MREGGREGRREEREVGTGKQREWRRYNTHQASLYVALKGRPLYPLIVIL